METLLIIVLVLSVIVFGWLGYILVCQIRENLQKKAQERERRAHEAAVAHWLARLEFQKRLEGKISRAAPRPSSTKRVSSSSQDAVDSTAHLYSLANLESDHWCSFASEGSSDSSTSSDSSSSCDTSSSGSSE